MLNIIADQRTLDLTLQCFYLGEHIAGAKYATGVLIVSTHYTCLFGKRLKSSRNIFMAGLTVFKQHEIVSLKITEDFHNRSCGVDGYKTISLVSPIRVCIPHEITRQDAI